MSKLDINAIAIAIGLAFSAGAMAQTMSAAVAIGGRAAGRNWVMGRH